MFGVLRPPKPPDPEWKAEYCHACAVLRKRYGRSATPFLSYEAVFLRSILRLLAHEGPACDQARCRCSFWRSPSCRGVTATDRFCVAFGLLLAKTKLEDDATDAPGWRGALARVLLWWYRNTFRKALDELRTHAADHITKVQKAVETHCAFERDRSFGLSPDGFCAPTAEGFAACFEAAADVAHLGRKSEVVGQIGRHLGRHIIAADVLDDVDTDRASAQPNPLIQHPEWASRFRFLAADSLRQLKMQIASSCGADDSVPMRLVKAHEARRQRHSSRKAGADTRHPYGSRLVTSLRQLPRTAAGLVFVPSTAPRSKSDCDGCAECGKNSNECLDLCDTCDRGIDTCDRCTEACDPICKCCNMMEGCSEDADLWLAACGIVLSGALIFGVALGVVALALVIVLVFRAVRSTVVEISGGAEDETLESSGEVSSERWQWLVAVVLFAAWGVVRMLRASWAVPPVGGYAQLLRAGLPMLVVSAVALARALCAEKTPGANSARRRRWRSIGTLFGLACALCVTSGPPLAALFGLLAVSSLVKAIRA